MDGHPRQNPAYRPATEKALVTGLFLWTRFAGDSSGSPRGGLDCGLRGTARRGRPTSPRRLAGYEPLRGQDSHTLRHVFASELLHAGANLRQIEELLGHKHLDSTQRYTRVNAHELRGAIKRLRWVG
jgi:integrase